MSKIAGARGSRINRRAEQRAAHKTGLPPIAAKADHLEAIKKSVEDAAAARRSMRAQLQGASLVGAQLQGASLY